eukprot:Blabericola_migrator_1__3454@NODE_201_length_11465_cov_262_571592_g173_i0_p4_GENE_NODE_201_length_11465_cov_262_571592_g173_i0NODE_201_length_11465_cov_262_571592_g173_i0_p4_ORF_typecomplete_len284_score34_12Nitroreductase/PF00881_24/1_5e26TM1586_NiRdase/PF14512_6/3_6e13_NODE_201_length_11465_cov_262_571592_g173_i0970910560
MLLLSRHQGLKLPAWFVKGFTSRSLLSTRLPTPHFTMTSNPAIELLLSHSSDRKYTPEPIAETSLQAILAAGQRAPTSKNAQLISVIIVRDQQDRKKIAELSGEQAWIAQCPVFLVVCGDLHKPNVAVKQATGAEIVTMSTAEGIVTTCVDAGIVLEAMMLAARSFDLGIVPIGGLRRGAAGIANLLSLPPYVIPIVGMCVGHVEKHAPIKPRLPLSTFAHEDRYNDEGLSCKMKEYDRVISKFWQTMGRTDGLNYSDSMASFMRTDYRPNLKEDYKAQGYTW